MMLKHAAFAALLAAAACAPQPYSSAARAQVQPAAACDAITLSPAVPFRALSDLGLTPLMNAQRLTPIRAHPLEGECASQVRVFDGTRFLLANGKTLTRGGGSTIAVPAPARNTIDPSVYMTSLDGAGADGEGFEFAHRIGVKYRNGVEHTSNLGVWRTGSGYEVRAFLMQGSELVRPIEPVLRSANRIFGLGFTPLPDAPMGSLHLVTENSPGEVTVASVNWHFQDFVTVD